MSTQTLNVCLYAGPGVGKTTTALGLTWHLSMMGVHVEYVPEYAKRLQYMGTLNTTSQKEILDGQIDWMAPLQGKVGVVVTDGPPIQSTAYAVLRNSDYLLGEIKDRMGHWDCMHLLLDRDFRGNYQAEGRYQNESQAYDFHKKMIIPYIHAHARGVREIQMGEGSDWIKALAQEIVAEKDRRHPAVKSQAKAA